MSIASVESLDHDGRGVAHCDGKVVFIEGALPGEVVEYASYRVKPSFEQAMLSRVLRASSQRVLPRCEFFGVCGGCSMQHLEQSAQVAAKQRVLENALWHIARVRPGVVYAPIHGPAWQYRERARLSIRCVPSKGGVLIGFHEKKSSYIADMRSCEILPAHVSALIQPLRKLVGALSIVERIPQVEVAVCETHTVLVLRHLQHFSRQDEARLLAFAEEHGVQLWLQPGGPETARPLRIEDPLWLEYSLPEFGVSLRFRPADFTQVNVHINRVLMRRAMHLLDPQPGELIADLFCGLGNFSLPIASRGAQVLGVEGSEAMVRFALENAQRNNLAERCRFRAANLFEVTPASLASFGRFDKLLIDPPREGAIAVCKALEGQAPGRIVYVSCNPATLARDAAILVHEKGYRLVGAGVANMFPQTSHVESIALFERG